VEMKISTGQQVRVHARKESSATHGDPRRPAARSPGTEATSLNRQILIVDDHQPFSSALDQSFRELRFEPARATTLPQACGMCLHCPPGLIVTELRVESQSVFDYVAELARVAPGAPVVIATVYPSVATAVRAVRLGFAGYLAKPTTARTILQLLESGTAADGPGPDQAAWPSLDRTIWEYLSQVVVVAGSLAEAARRLGVDRRSLRRMLAKYPPAR
jgi:two-component system response regulator RegA